MYYITKSCVCCYTCEGDCPAGAIHEDESGDFMVIDQEACLDCGHCAEVCPKGAVMQKDQA